MALVSVEIGKYYWFTMCWERGCEAFNIIASEQPIDDPDENDEFQHCHNCGATLKGWDQGWAETDEERREREATSDT